MAGPPVEVQVRVNTGGSVAGSVSNWKVMSPGIVTWPVGGETKTITELATAMLHCLYVAIGKYLLSQTEPNLRAVRHALHVH